MRWPGTGTLASATRCLPWPAVRAGWWLVFLLPVRFLSANCSSEVRASRTECRGRCVAQRSRPRRHARLGADVLGRATFYLMADLEIRRRTATDSAWRSLCGASSRPGASSLESGASTGCSTRPSPRGRCTGVPADARWDGGAEVDPIDLPRVFSDLGGAGGAEVDTLAVSRAIYLVQDAYLERVRLYDVCEILGP
jgi:hypothetical protein